MDWLHGGLVIAVLWLAFWVWHRGQLNQQLRGDVLRAQRERDEHKRKHEFLMRELGTSPAVTDAGDTTTMTWHPVIGAVSYSIKRDNTPAPWRWLW